MLITRPHYYDSFRCIAGACPDSCCKEWSVQVDEASAAVYRSLPGALGDKLRSVLAEEEGCTVMTIENGRCPMWRDDGLCRIQSELGEDALCQVCRDFPRLRHDFGDFMDLQLELSCPEAARLILTSPMLPPITQELPGGDAPEYDPESMAAAKAIRAELLDILADERRSPAQALLEVYRRGTGMVCQPGTAGDFEGIREFYLSLETLTPQWPRLLEQARPRPLDSRVRQLARYLLERYFLQEQLEDTLGKLTFIIASCLMISALDGDFVEMAQLYSKEIENSDCNPYDLMDAAYTEEAFSPGNLTALLLNS